MNQILSHSQIQNLIRSQRSLNFFCFWIHSMSQIHHCLKSSKNIWIKHPPSDSEHQNKTAAAAVGDGFSVKQEKVYFGGSWGQTSSDPLLEEPRLCCCCCCFLSMADLCTARMLGLDFQNCNQLNQPVRFKDSKG